MKQGTCPIASCFNKLEELDWVSKSHLGGHLAFQHEIRRNKKCSGVFWGFSTPFKKGVRDGLRRDDIQHVMIPNLRAKDCFFAL